MLIRKENLLRLLVCKHSNALNPVSDWTAKTRAARWQSFPDVRETFNSASYVKPFVVFNLGGNNYRLLTRVDYAEQTVTIVKAVTHRTWRL